MAELERGSKIGEWEVERVLGRGAFGITYRARKGVEDSRVQYAAIKEFFPSEYAIRSDSGHVTVTQLSKRDFAEERALFHAEADKIRQFDHKNIVRGYNIIEEYGTSYFAMELVDGPNLAQIVRKSRTERDPLTAGQLRPALLDLLDALAHIHSDQPPLLHRDIKPANVVFRTSDKSPVLIDFGAARNVIAERSQKLTAILTKGYAPYEQYASDAEDWDDLEGDVDVISDMPPQGPYTDIYSLGATCYFALTGFAPRDSLYRKMTTDTLKPLVSRVSGEKSFLSSIDKALAVEPAERFQSADEWLEALEDEKRFYPISASGPVDEDATVIAVPRKKQSQSTTPQTPLEEAPRNTEFTTQKLEDDLGFPTGGISSGNMAGVASTKDIVAYEAAYPFTFWRVIPLIFDIFVALCAYVIFGLGIGVAVAPGGESSDDRIEAGWTTTASLVHDFSQGGILAVAAIVAILPLWVAACALLQRKGTTIRHLTVSILGAVWAVGVIIGTAAFLSEITGGILSKGLSDLEEFSLSIQKLEGVGYLVSRIVLFGGMLGLLFLTLEVIRSIQFLWKRDYREKVIAFQTVRLMLGLKGDDK